MVATLAHGGDTTLAIADPRTRVAGGVAPDTPVVGTDSGREFSRVLLGDLGELDVAAAERDVLDAADRLCADHPEVGAIVLECTNMMPYASAVRLRTRLPVYDNCSFATWFHYGLEPRRLPRALA